MFDSEGWGGYRFFMRGKVVGSSSLGTQDTQGWVQLGIRDSEMIRG